MNNAVISIVCTECKSAAEKETTVRGRLIAAFKVARNHWMATDEQEQFQGAVAAVHILSNEEDKRRLEQELLLLRTLNAASSGVPVAFEDLPVPTDPIGVLGLWHESKHEQAKGQA